MAIYVPHSKIVIAGLSYVQPVVDVSYLQIKVTAEVSMPDVLAVDIVTPADELVFAFNKAATDSASLTDNAARSIDKPSSDGITPADDITRIATAKQLTEAATITETALYVLTKLLGPDFLTPVDVAAWGFSKALTPETTMVSAALTGKSVEKSLSDAITLSDTAEAYKLYIRAFSDEFSTPDAYAELFVSGVTADSSTATDAYNHALTKNFFESSVLIDNMDGDIQYNFIKLVGELLTASDVKVVDFAANKSDNVTSSDSGVLSMQDYCDITYFLEDYVGISRTF